MSRGSLCAVAATVAADDRGVSKAVQPMSPPVDTPSASRIQLDADASSGKRGVLLEAPTVLHRVSHP